jgi:hypothetical protein
MKASTIDFEVTYGHLERRKEELRRAAVASEAKLYKFTEYLISKIGKRRDQVRDQIQS